MTKQIARAVTEETFKAWSTHARHVTLPGIDGDQAEIDELIEGGALFAISTSGGKDSIATYLAVTARVPHAQCVLVHADLGEAEHTGLIELIERQNVHHLPLVIAKARHADGTEKSMFSMIEMTAANYAAKGKDITPMPVIGNQTCRATGELKTQPIIRDLKQWAKAHGFDQIINVTGVRGAESPKRAKDINERGPLFFDANESNGLWDIYHWRPIAFWSVEAVFTAIDLAGIEMHQAYRNGNHRLSCAFCSFGSAGDLQRAAEAYPALAAKFIKWETEIGHTYHVSRKPLAELLNVREIA